MREFYIKNKNTAGRTIKGNAYIIVPEDNMMYMLNSIGSFIWELLNCPCSIAGISKELYKKYDISKKEALKDARKFLKELASLKIALKQTI